MGWMKSGEVERRGGRECIVGISTIQGGMESAYGMQGTASVCSIKRLSNLSLLSLLIFNTYSCTVHDLIYAGNDPRNPLSTHLQYTICCI